MSQNLVAEKKQEFLSKPPWRMPLCYRGQIVLWYEGGVKDEDHAMPALIKVEGHSSLHLYVFGDRPFDMDCVHHIDDPYLKEGERNTQGAWDFTLSSRKE